MQNNGVASLLGGNVKLYGIVLGVSFLLSILFSGLAHLGGNSEEL